MLYRGATATCAPHRQEADQLQTFKVLAKETFGAPRNLTEPVRAMLLPFAALELGKLNLTTFCPFTVASPLTTPFMPPRVKLW